MHIFLLGATGPSGLVFLSSALACGHELTIYARNPSKLPPDTASNPSVHLVQGEFTDRDTVQEALAHGAEVLVSFVGPSLPPSTTGTPVADFYRTTLFPLILSHSKISRAMITSTASYADPRDAFSAKWWLGVTAIKWLAGSAYAEINGMSRAAIEGLPLERVEWTLFRVPILTNGRVHPVQTGYVGGGNDSMRLTRSSMCVWLLNEIEEGKWVGQAPAISNPGWM